MEEMEQVPNTYYYDKLYDDRRLGSFTEITAVAYQLGWQDNHVLITDTEVSDVNGWIYLKGYAPKKSKEALMKELKEEKHAELKSIMQTRRNAIQAVQALYAEYWELKNRLAACKTVAEVEAITWQEASK